MVSLGYMWRHVWQNIGAQQGKSVPAAAAGEDTIARHRLANDNAAPDPVTTKDDGVQRIEGIGLDVSSTGSSSYCIRGENPLSAVAELQRADAVARGEWRVRIETHLRVSCDRDSFKLQARLRAWHGDAQICDRAWNPTVPRDLM